MMAGATVTPAALEHAGALIAAARALARRGAECRARPAGGAGTVGGGAQRVDMTVSSAVLLEGAFAVLALTLARSRGYAALEWHHRPSGSPRAA